MLAVTTVIVLIVDFWFESWSLSVTTCLAVICIVNFFEVFLCIDNNIWGIWHFKCLPPAVALVAGRYQLVFAVLAHGAGAHLVLLLE